MKKKLVCILVDDDPETHEIFRRILANSSIAELKYTFFNATDFLRSEKKLTYDVVLLDIMLPDINGFSLSQKISKPYIFISGFKDRIFEAIELVGPIDVVPKPTQENRLNAALEKAYQKILDTYQNNSQYCELFNVAGKKGKVNIILSEIYYVKVDDKDRRNKNVVLKNGEGIKLMDCTFVRLLESCKNLCQINKSEMISFDILDSIDYDTVNIKKMENHGLPTWATLSPTYKDILMERLHEYNK